MKLQRPVDFNHEAIKNVNNNYKYSKNSNIYDKFMI
jgi:hypothetical protein